MNLFWRPRDWQNPYKYERKLSGLKKKLDSWDKADAYEAGADAMLEAVKSQEVTYGYNEDFDCYGLEIHIFIPDIRKEYTEFDLIDL